MTSKSSERLASTDVNDRIDEWRQKAGRVNAEAALQILEDPTSRSVLRMVFSRTPYLAKCCLAHPDAVIEALSGDPERVVAEVERDLMALDRAAGSVTSLTRAVRPCKERAVVAIGLADLSGRWPIEKVGQAIGKLGQLSVESGLSWLSRLAYRNGDIGFNGDALPVPLPGLFVVGGNSIATDETGYCGPIDLAMIYDEKMLSAAGIKVSHVVLEKIATQLRDAFHGNRDMPAIFDIDFKASATTGKINMKSESVFRKKMLVDLLESDNPRLHSWFSNAVPIAGDRKVAVEFLRDLKKTFWASDISASSIRGAVGLDDKSEIGVLEVDRLTQTCRLALGTKTEAVRNGCSTIVFESAVKAGSIDRLTASRLVANANFLHVARNRLQLVTGLNDSVDCGDDLRRDCAILCGFSDLELFDKVLDGSIAEARQHWLNIVSPPTDSSRRATTISMEEANLARLEEIGFTDGRAVASTIDGWVSAQQGEGNDHRRYLSEITPGFLTEIGRTQGPDRAIELVDAILGKLPSEYRPLEQLASDSRLADALVDFAGNTPVFAEQALANEIILEEMFDPDFEIPANPDAWITKFPAPTSKKGCDKAFVDRLHNWLSENETRLCFRALSQDIPAEEHSLYLTAFAETAVQAVYDGVSAEFDDRIAEIGGAIALIASGDFGATSLKTKSPLDLAFVFDGGNSKEGDEKVATLYCDFAARMTKVLESTGAEKSEPMFSIDPRSRPGGATGDAACAIPVYLNFYSQDARPEEHLALTRARLICGPLGIRQRLEASITECVTQPRKAERLMIEADKAHMRVQKQNPPESIWDVDRIRGGLADLDFIAEVLQVRNGAENPYVMAQSTPDAFSALSRAGCLDPDTATDLIESHLFWTRLRTILALSDGFDMSSQRPRQRLGMMIAAAAGVTNFGSVEPLIQGHAERVTAHYRKLVLGDENASPINAAIAV